MTKVDEQLQKISDRPVAIYDVPEAERFMFDEIPVVSMGFVELTPREELMALKRANGSAEAAAYESAKACIVEVNEKPIDKTNGDVDRLWQAMGPRGRQLVIMAYGELHQPSQATQVGFLKSRRTRA